MKALNIAMAAVGGAIIGVAIGMLAAPKKGSEARKDIVDFIKEKCPFMKQDKVEELAEKIAEEMKA